MARDAGRTGRGGNKAGKPARIMINMKDPMKHLHMGSGTQKGQGKGGKSGRMKGY